MSSVFQLQNGLEIRVLACGVLDSARNEQSENAILIREDDKSQ